MCSIAIIIVNKLPSIWNERISNGDVPFTAYMAEWLGVCTTSFPAAIEASKS